MFARAVQEFSRRARIHEEFFFGRFGIWVVVAEIRLGLLISVHRRTLAIEITKNAPPEPFTS